MPVSPNLNNNVENNPSVMPETIDSSTIIPNTNVPTNIPPIPTVPQDIENSYDAVNVQAQKQAIHTKETSSTKKLLSIII